MEFVVIFLLLKSLKSLTTGGTVQLQERRLLLVTVDAAGGGLCRGLDLVVLLCLLWSWLGAKAVSLELVEPQRVLPGEGELATLEQTAVLVVQVDMSFKSIRPLEVLVTLSTNAVVILGRFFVWNLPNLGTF